MKQKTHSGAKKTVKITKRGLRVNKAAKRHLLINKSDRQKNIGEKPVHPTRVRAVRRMLKGVKALGKQNSNS